MRVRKAIIPVAGFATRWLPASKSVPKVMLPVLDTPIIHFTVKEAVEAGIEQIIFIISQGQEAIRAYFHRMPSLEKFLEQRNATTHLERILDIPIMPEDKYVLQHKQAGLGHAVLMAENLIGEEPFAILLPDDLIWADAPTISTMIDMARNLQSSIIAVKEVPESAIPNLGIIKPGNNERDTYEITGLVEKPTLAQAPSNLGIIGRYVLPPTIFKILKQTPPGAIGEIQLTDAIASLLRTQKVYGYRFPGMHFDVGTPVGLMKASIFASLQRDNLAEEIKKWLSNNV